MIFVPFVGMKAQSTVVDGQSTEGKDFWVTFMQADQDDNNSLQLSLSISSREDCQVTITNPFTGYSENVTVTANQMQLVELYNGNVLSNNARTAMTSTGKVCYAVNSEKADTCALHVTSTANISLFATNYKKATFDATNVLPTASLLDEYIIQTYTPSDHGGTGSTQGSHFAVIAAEDNTVREPREVPFDLASGERSRRDVHDRDRPDELLEGQVRHRLVKVRVLHLAEDVRRRVDMRAGVQARVQRGRGPAVPGRRGRLPPAAGRKRCR